MRNVHHGRGVPGLSKGQSRRIDGPSGYDRAQPGRIIEKPIRYIGNFFGSLSKEKKTYAARLAQAADKLPRWFLIQEVKKLEASV